MGETGSGNSGNPAAGNSTARRDPRQAERDRRAQEALRRTQHMYVHLPVGRLYAKVAAPGAVSMLLSALYQLFEGLLVGNFLGERAFAAVNLAMPFVVVNFAFADMIAVGSSVVISIALGKKQDRKADELFTVSVLLVEALAVVMGVLLFFGAPPIMTAMGAKGAFHRDAVIFLRVYAVCSPLTTLVDAVDNYLKICGAVNYSLVVNIVLAVLGVGLDYLFLAVFGWGVAGAALGFCLAMFVAVLMAMVPLASGRMRLRFVRPRWDAQAIKSMVGNGLPDFLDNVAGRIFAIVLNSALVRFGGAAAVSVYGIVQYVDGVFLPIMYGLVDSTQPAVGYNWGAGLKDRVRALVRLNFLVCGTTCALAALAVLVFPRQLALVFVPSMPAAQLAMCVVALRLMAATYATRWVAYVIVAIFQALSRPREAVVLSVLYAFVFPFLVLGLLWGLGLTGIWLNTPLTTALTAAVSVALYAARRPLD